MNKFTCTAVALLPLLFTGCIKELETPDPKGQNESETITLRKGTTPPPSLVQWQTCWGTAADDFGGGIAATTGGGYFIAGTINGRESGYVMKVGADKMPAWTAPVIVNGNGMDELSSVVATSDGGCLVTGITSSTDLPGSSSSTDVLLAKISGTGTLDWVAAIGTAESERGNTIIKTADGGFALTGYSGDHFLVVKLNASAEQSPDGMIDWQERYLVPGHKGCTGYSITQDGDALVIGGRALGMDIATPGPLFAKLDVATGNLLTARVLENHGDGLAFDIETIGSGYVLAGRSGCEALVFSVDKNGNPGWVRTYGGAGCLDLFRSIVVTSDGYVLVGETNSKNGDIPGSKGGIDVWLMKIGNDGTRISSYTFGGKDDDKGDEVLTGSADSYMIVGSTRSKSGDVSGNKGLSDIWALEVKLP